MFDYTKAIFNKTMSDLKLFAKVWTIGTLGVYIAYLIYALIAHSGFLAANIILLVLSVAYFVFNLIVIIKGNELLKSRKRFAKKTYKYSKYVINSVTLITALYSIWLSPYNVHPFKLLITVFMAIMLVVQLALEVSVTIVEKRFSMFIEAFNADIEFVTKPVNTVKNVFKKITGQEVEPEKEYSKDRIYLNDLMEQERKIKSQKKADAKAERNEKISSWLDSRISKLKGNRKKKEQTEELQALDSPYVMKTENSEDETV